MNSNGTNGSPPLPTQKPSFTTPSSPTVSRPTMSTTTTTPLSTIEEVEPNDIFVRESAFVAPVTMTNTLIDDADDTHTTNKNSGLDHNTVLCHYLHTVPLLLLRRWELQRIYKNNIVNEMSIDDGTNNNHNQSRTSESSPPSKKQEEKQYTTTLEDIVDNDNNEHNSDDNTVPS